MPVSVTVGKENFEGDNRYHAEEKIFQKTKYKTGDLEIVTNAWPCVGERGHNCHNLFIRESQGRKITLTVMEDHAGYAANHGRPFGSKGTITYHNKEVKYK